MRYDVNNTDGCLAGEKRRVQESQAMSEGNKMWLFEYLTYAEAHNKSFKPGTQLKHLKLLRNMGEKFFQSQSFDAVTLSDIERLAVWVKGLPISPYSKANYRIVAKSFFRFLKTRTGKKFDVSWLATSFPNPTSVVSKYKPEEIPTPENCLRGMDYCSSLRDKLLWRVTFLTGGRLGEILPVTLGDVFVGDSKIIFRVNGKTGPRDVEIEEFSTVQLAKDYAKTLPDDKNLCFWSGKAKPPSRAWYWGFLKKIGTRAGIKKANPHAFRYARATDLDGVLSDYERARFLGWVPNSEMPRHYTRKLEKTVFAKVAAHDNQNAEPLPDPSVLKQLQAQVAELQEYKERYNQELQVTLERVERLQNLITERAERLGKTCEEVWEDMNLRNVTLPSGLIDSLMKMAETPSPSPTDMGAPNVLKGGGVVGYHSKNWTFQNPSDRELVALALMRIKKTECPQCDPGQSVSTEVNDYGTRSK